MKLRGGDDFQIRVEFQLFLLFDTGLSRFFFWMSQSSTVASASV